MSLLKTFGDAFRKGADLQIYGAGGSRRSTRTQRLALSGSNFDYASEAGPLYDNGVVLPAINWKAGAIGEATLRVRQFDASKQTWDYANERGAVADLLSAFRNPNDYYDGLTMWQGVQLSWDTRGNSYLYIRKGNSGRPVGFYWIPHFNIRPLADVDNADGTKLVTRYEYTPFNGPMQYKRLDEILQFRHGIDPRDPASGLSPLAAELRDICLDNEVSTWLASVVRNGATPGAIISPDASVGPTEYTLKQKNDLADLWDTFTADKRGKAFFSPLPIDVTIPTWSPQQMELGALRDVPMVRIMAALGLDPMVLGFSSEKQTFANKEQAIDDAGKRTVLPTMRRWANQASHKILPMFNLDPAIYQLWWDTTGVSWLVDDVLAKNKSVREDYKAGVIDRFTAKTESGRPTDDEDKGVYASAASAIDPIDSEDAADAAKAANLKALAVKIAQR